MPIWQVQICETTIWSNPSRLHVSAERDDIFKELPNVFGIVDDILIVDDDADGKDYNRMLKQVMQICCKENLELNKEKCDFRWLRASFFSETISRCGVQPDPHKLCVLTDIPPLLTKINYSHS